MKASRGQRWLGLAGLVFVVLVVIAVATTTNVSSHASAAEVVASVHKHKTGLQFSAFDTGLARP